PKLLLKERQALSSRISIARWKRCGKLRKSVVRAAAANSNKGSLIGIWPRTTSGFTSNCSAIHRLKLQPRVARIKVKANREAPMPTKRSRKTRKRTVAEPHKGDQGDTKRGGSAVERIVRKLTGGVGARSPDYQNSPN